VQLSIFLIGLFVGTYRLSSHARLEAFVIQTKLTAHLMLPCLELVQPFAAQPTFNRVVRSTNFQWM